MKHKIEHLSDQELIMAADGELPPRRAARVKEHLATCWSCRERAETFERTIGELVRERHAELDCRITPPEGPRARLRARLAEMSRAPAAPAFHWMNTMRHAMPAVLVLVCGLGLAVAMFFRPKIGVEGPRPEARLTPGEARTVSIAEVCRSPRAEVVAADIPDAMRRKVFLEYGIKGHPDNFEIDYLITPDLGGTLSMRNLWPQPYSTRWNAHVKDMLEQRLHELVCDGQVDLTTAQHDIAADWIGAYKKYFHTDGPL